MASEIRMTLLHHSTNDLVEELLMWRGLAAEHLDRIAELEEENETLKTACDILRGDNNLLFKRLMSIETPGDLQTLKIVYVKEDSEVQE